MQKAQKLRGVCVCVYTFLTPCAVCQVAIVAVVKPLLAHLLRNCPSEVHLGQSCGQAAEIFTLPGSHGGGAV